LVAFYMLHLKKIKKDMVKFIKLKLLKELTDG